MLGSSLINVILVLFLVYLYLSLTCSALNEWLAGLLQRRGKLLKDAICHLVGPTITKAFYRDPVIQSLKARQAGERVFSVLAEPKVRSDRLPSTIAPEVFSEALLRVFVPPAITAAPQPMTLQALREQIVALYSRTKGEAPPADPPLPTPMAEASVEIDTPTTIMLMTILEGVGDEVITSAAATLGLSGATYSIPHNELGVVKRRLGQWYQDALDSATGAYKRKAQTYLILWAFAVCLLFNADTIRMARLIYVPQQQQIVLAAVRGLPAPPAGTDFSATAKLIMDDLLRNNALPLGWTRNPLDYSQEKNRPHGFGRLLALKLLGLLITTVAVAQGAPFWFDLLGRVVNLRLAGPSIRSSAAAKNTPSR